MPPGNHPGGVHGGGGSVTGGGGTGGGRSGGPMGGGKGGAASAALGMGGNRTGAPSSLFTPRASSGVRRRHAPRKLSEFTEEEISTMSVENPELLAWLMGGNLG